MQKTNSIIFYFLHLVIRGQRRVGSNCCQTEQAGLTQASHATVLLRRGRKEEKHLRAISPPSLIITEGLCLSSVSTTLKLKSLDLQLLWGEFFRLQLLHQHLHSLSCWHRLSSPQNPCTQRADED